MRVISGKYGSRPLKAVPGMNTRPTTDKIKESLFSLAGGWFDGGNCLDFYGGSGALAIEAISRGMEEAVITEKYRPAVQTIRANIDMTQEAQRFHLLVGDNRAVLRSFLQQHPSYMFDLVLLDPPYAKQQIVADIEWLILQGCVDEYTRIVCETDDGTDLPQMIGPFVKIKHKHYGQTFITIYDMEEVEDD